MDPLRPRGPRLYHKKSRTGCIRCKQRRVKCDEARPSCGGCSRHMVECVYPVQATSPSSSSGTAAASASTARVKSRAAAYHATASASLATSLEKQHQQQQQHLHTTTQTSPSSSHADDNLEPDLDLPESRQRRIWELRLLHNNFTMAQPFPTQQEPEVLHLWNIDVPNMALVEGRDAILYGLLAHSALNMWTRSTSPKEREELIVLQQTYLGLLLREQRRDVVRLSPENADHLCFSSLKILSHSLALVQTLPMDPWEPPTEWLQMGRGAGAVFKAAYPLVNPEHGNKIITFFRSPPVMVNPDEIIGCDNTPLRWLLDHPARPDSDAARADTELDDAEILSVYEKALSYTCSVQRGIDRGEPEYAICRRLGGFAVWVPSEFTQFLVEKRPRALVILAHFMSLWLEYENIWIIGKAGEKQIRGIHKNLPLEWTSKLDGLFAKFKAPGELKPIIAGKGISV